MRLTRIIVDESSDLEEDFARKLKIAIIPFNIINKDGKSIRIIPNRKENLEEGIFSSKDSFFRYLSRAKKKDDIPTTGAISVEKGKIKYFNRAAQSYVGELDIEEIKMRDEIILYLHPEFLKETEGKLFSSGKEEPFLFEGKRYSFKLQQLYIQDEHMGAKLEIKKK